MDLIPSQILKIFLAHLEEATTMTEKIPVQINVKKSQNRVTFKIESGYYLEL